MAATSFLQSTTAQPAHNNTSQSPSSRGVRFPAWAFARRISSNNSNRRSSSNSTGCCQDTMKPMLKDSCSKIRQLQHHVRQAAAQGPQATKQSISNRSLPQDEIITQSTTLDTVSSAESQAEMTTTTTTTLPLTLSSTPLTSSSAPLRLKIDVTGVSLQDLRVQVDPQTHKLVVSGMGPIMFKRSYPLPTNTNHQNLKVFISKSESGNNQYLTLVEEQRSGRPELANDHPSS